MAPVTRGVADAHEHWLALGSGPIEGLLAPGKPVHRVVCVLHDGREADFRVRLPLLVCLYGWFVLTIIWAAFGPDGSTRGLLAASVLGLLSGGLLLSCLGGPWWPPGCLPGWPRGPNISEKKQSLGYLVFPFPKLSFKFLQFPATILRK